jgi:hypothetical protein
MVLNPALYLVVFKTVGFTSPTKPKLPPTAKYGVRSLKFIWAPVYSSTHWLRPPQLPLPPHLGSYTVKKGYRFSSPQPGCHKPNSPWMGINQLFPFRESLVSDPPAGDGKTANLFFTVYTRALLVSQDRRHLFVPSPLLPP